MSKQSEIREQVTAKIVAALEKDLLPWRRMWTSNNRASTTTPRRASRTVGSIPSCFKSTLPSMAFNRRPGPRSTNGRRWAAASIEGPMMSSLGSGEQRWPSTSPSTRRSKTPREDEEEEETYWILKKFVVFNADQVSGAAAEQFQVVEQPAEIQLPTSSLPSNSSKPPERKSTSAVTGPTTGCRRQQERGRITPQATGSVCRRRLASSVAASIRPSCTNLPIGPKSESDGIGRRTAIRWGNSLPR